MRRKDEKQSLSAFYLSDFLILNIFERIAAIALGGCTITIFIFTPKEIPTQKQFGNLLVLMRRILRSDIMICRSRSCCYYKKIKRLEIKRFALLLASCFDNCRFGFVLFAVKRDQALLRFHELSFDQALLHFLAFNGRLSLVAFSCSER